MSLPRARIRLQQRRPERASNTQSRDQTVREQCGLFQTFPNIPAPAKNPSDPDTAGHELAPASPGAGGHSSCSSGIRGALPAPDRPHSRGEGKLKDSQPWNHLQQLCSPLCLLQGWGHEGQGHRDGTSLRNTPHPKRRKKPPKLLCPSRGNQVCNKITKWSHGLF